MGLYAIGIESKAINFIAQELGEDPFASKIFGDCSDAPSGKLKFNVGLINLGEKEQISIDTRIPVTVSKDEIVKKLSVAAARYGLEYKEFDWLGPLYLSKDHPVIQTLLKVYRQYSGDQAGEPISLGGATYARAFDNCVAFGPLFPDELLTEHEANERVILKNLFLAMKIYAYAIYELTR
jgi:acetylornithine deacetylase/succinyl-diaminopimelate desuccinylase-like protein